MKKNQARESIFRTASRLFYKQGYSNTGINQIIEEAKITKSTLYQHFRSKEELLIAYLDETGLLTIKALKDVSQTRVTAKEKVLAIFNYLEDLVVRTDFYGCHFLTIVYEIPDGEESAGREIRKQKNAVRQILREIVEPIGKMDLADEIYTLFEGVLIAHKVHGATWPIASAKSTINKLL